MALPPKADIAERDHDVRFVPKADILRCGKERRYSITSSDVAGSNQWGAKSPSSAIFNGRHPEADPASHFTDRVIILMTLLIAGAGMAFAVHQWRRGP